MKKLFLLISVTMVISIFTKAAEVENIRVLRYPEDITDKFLITADLSGQFVTNPLASLTTSLALSLGEHLKIQYQVQLVQSKPWWFDEVRNEYTYEYDFWKELITGEEHGTLTYSSDGSTINLPDDYNWEDYVRHLGIVENLEGVLMSMGTLTQEDFGNTFYFKVRAKSVVPWGTDDKTDWSESSKFILEKGPSLSSITISGPTSVYENSSTNYTCTANYSDGSTQNVTSSASWSVSPSTYATIGSSTGVLKTSSVSSDQSCTIETSFGGKSGTKSVTIKNVSATLNSITISGAASVNENSSASYTCTANYSDGSTQNVTSSASWSVIPTSYATIGSSTGVLTTSSVSSDQFCTIKANFGGKSGTISVTIKNVLGTLSSITISGVASVNENSSTSYTCTANYSDGSTQNVTSSASWSVTPTTYATIGSSTGVLTTSSVSSDQSCSISAIYGGKSVTYNITIKNNVSDDIKFLFPSLNQEVSLPVSLSWEYNGTMSEDIQFYLRIKKGGEDIYGKAIEKNETIVLENQSLFVDGTYEWIIEVIKNGTNTKFSSTFIIKGGQGCTPGIFSNFYPNSTSVDVPLNPELSWNYSKHRDGLTYEVWQIFDTGSGRVVAKTSSQSIQITETEFWRLQYGVTYSWLVTVVDCNSYIISDIISFTTSTSSDLFSEVYPPNNAVNIPTNAVLSWKYKNHTSNTLYRVLVGFDSPVGLHYEGNDQSFNISNIFEGGVMPSNTKLAWKIEVYEDANYITSSQNYYFTTGDKIPDYPKKAINPTPANNADNILGDQMIKLSWELENDGADPVDCGVIWWESGATDVSDIFTHTVVENEYEIYVKSNQTYYWKVQTNLEWPNYVMSDIWSFTTINSTSVDNFSNNNSIILYPTLVKDKFIVETFDITENDVIYKVIDLNGLTVLTIKRINQKQEIDCSNLKSGVYLFNIICNNKNKTIKFIKK